MTWCWNWYAFYVDSPLLSDVAMSWKTVNLAHFAELKIHRYCHFMPFDKKLACLANYQERRSFPWPLVQYISCLNLYTYLYMISYSYDISLTLVLTLLLTSWSPVSVLALILMYWPSPDSTVSPLIITFAEPLSSQRTVWTRQNINSNLILSAARSYNPFRVTEVLSSGLWVHCS